MSEFLKRFLTSIILLPIFFYFIYLSNIYLIILLFFFYILSAYEIYKNSKSIKLNIFGNIVLILAFFSLFFLRGETNYTLVILLWILISTFLSDIGGYVFGKIFKGKKLTKVSPKKTYSGAVGSLFLSVISLPLVNFLQKIFFNEILINIISYKYFTLTLLVSIICQTGDIFVSSIKRKINIKDTSNLLPGHGGIIDRIDGLIFVLIISSVLKISGIL